VGDRRGDGLGSVKKLFASERGQFLERYTSPHTHPGGSISRTTVQKLRVLGTFVARRLLLGRGRYQALARLRELAGYLSGREILVIGSGPSAEKLNLREVRKRQSTGELVVIATNYFLHSPLARTVTPDYLVWADTAFDPSNSRNSSPEWKVLQSYERLSVVVPWTWRSYIDSTPMAARTIYFDNDSLEGWSGNISPLKPRGYQGSTGVKALAIALHFGSEKVAVIGLDLSNFRALSVNAANEVFRGPAHLEGTDSGVQNITHESVRGLADALYSAASQFLVLHTHFDRERITNLDPNSLVDAFPKARHHPLVKRGFAART